MSLLSKFEQQQKAFKADCYPSLMQRREHLLAIKRMLQEHASELVDAVNQDFSHRSSEETLFLEIFPTLKAIDYCLKNLKKWMKPRKRSVSWYLKPAKAYVLAQPLGVIGIITPWNYPIFLSIIPMIYAFAAGNHAMIKFSELTPKTGEIISLLLANLPVINEMVTVVNGDSDIAKEFSSLPFGHLLFTGSTDVGRQVMAAASKNLTPVTLELGGKSPVIISSRVNPAYLERLFMGKLFNAGQTCVAPDYLLIPQGFEKNLETLFEQFLSSNYPMLMSNNNYSSIISEHHKARLENLVCDAKNKSARIVQFGDQISSSRKLPVYLLFNVTPAMHIMNEEIFGPLLPVIVYSSFSEAIEIIQSKPNPLALYYFGDDAKEMTLLQSHTLSGALTINDTVMHTAIDSLPFGGVGNSGMGHYHGQEGFDTFSKMKPVFIQRRFSPVSWFYPPYGKLLHLFLRYFAGIKLKGKK